jgi:capsular polysaccharide transport system permease protein
MVPIQIDEQSGLITILVKTFDPALSQKVLARILVTAEAYMNQAASELASGQLAFLKEQIRKAGDDLEKARTDLVQFQDKNKLLTPQDTANTVLGAIGRLEGDLVVKRTELSAALSYLHPQSPEAIRLKSQIKALEGQIVVERGRLVGPGDMERLSVSSAAYEKQKMQVEFAADIYKTALGIYEKAQYDAAKKSQAVVLVQPPTLPEEPSYPRLLRDIPISLLLGYLVLLLVSLVVQVVREHR